MLSVERLAASYGPAQVLFDISFSVDAGEVVTLIGRNGMGKTTTIFALMGLVPPEGGTATFDGQSLVGLPPFRIAQAGLGLVPEGRQIFPTLTVEENLVATGAARFGTKQWTLERVYDFFPALAERRSHMGNELSGGEQQMLAIGRALMTQPRFLMLDEPSQGIMPRLVDDILAAVTRIRDLGVTVLLVEQRLVEALAIADRAYVLQTGRIVLSGLASDIAADDAVRRAYLGI